MKSKIFLLFIFSEVTLLLIGGALYKLISDTKKGIENVECSLDCCVDEEEELNIVVTSPLPNDIVSSPLTVEGKARGGWFFEGDFPIVVYGEGCEEIALSCARTEEYWMTDDFISFQGTIEFDPGNSEYGTLVFEKDNPAGCVQYDDNLIIPIKFK